MNFQEAAHQVSVMACTGHSSPWEHMGKLGLCPLPVAKQTVLIQLFFFEYFLTILVNSVRRKCLANVHVI